jgi:Zn finger protein HypA/HybF involved in hydrogenase expression
MRQKANEVREEKITGFRYAVEAAFTNPKLYEFMEACYDRHNLFEEKEQRYEKLLQNAAGEQDLETAYRNLLEEFETIRDRFACTQCSGNITIPQLFFIATYVTCPHCQTQNTFHPSTEAQMVLHNARALAERRTAHLLKAYESGTPKDSALYRQYLRAMFDEWNSIVPDIAEENEKFHERLLKDHENYHHY